MDGARARPDRSRSGGVDTGQAARRAHAALEWPPAAITRVRVRDDGDGAPMQSLVFHARAGDAGGRD